MIKNINNSKSKNDSGYKGIYIRKDGKYIARLGVFIPEGHSAPKKPKLINIGVYDNKKQAKQARVDYILDLL